MRIALVVSLLIAIASPLAGQSADVVQKALASEALKLRAWSSEKVIVDAVKKYNAANVPAAEVQRIDAEWIAGGAAAMVKQVTTGTCADRLRALAAQDARYGETFVTGANGAVVCATSRTSDYWQGDEAKWTRAFHEGTFIDRPRLDESANARLAQISLPITDGGKTVGVITIGVDVGRLR